MAAIDPVRYLALAPLFTAALATRSKPGATVAWNIWCIIQHLTQADNDQAQIGALRPYALAFLEDVRTGRADPFATPPRLPPSQPDGVKQDQTAADLLTGLHPERDAAERAMMDQLIAATSLYDSAEAIRDLFSFTIRLRAFSPFNAMLLHIQKPGITHAATAHDWHRRFQRVPKVGARPLVVLRMMGPVDFVFDVQDTEGRPLPENAFTFPTLGQISDNKLGLMLRRLAKDRIDILPLDLGDSYAGWIRIIGRSSAKTGRHQYQLAYNRNHPPPTRFVTIAHELAHLYLGHLGEDAGRRVPDRADLSNDLAEAEAEIVAYLVAKRNGLSPRSEGYLANYKGALGDLDLHSLTRAANAIETAMGISAQTLWNAKGQT